MYNLKSTTCLAFFFINFFRDFDNDFLQSLPNDVRKDVLARANDQFKILDNYSPYHYSKVTTSWGTGKFKKKNWTD